jgi:DNA repair protein RadC
MKITDWALEDRPREKLARQGVAVLTDAELIAILLRSGNRDKSAVALAREVMQACDNNLVKLGRMTLNDFRQFSGLGVTKGASILAALELGRRRAQSADNDPQQPITRSEQIFAHFHHRMADLSHEELWAVYLSRGAKILHTQRISSGGTDFAGADIKMIVQPALQYMAGNVAVCHNHPHGQPRPSTQDRQMTAKLHDALKLFDIRLMDHLIIADHEYYSFADNGDL